jgi:hypothetical protein
MLNLWYLLFVNVFFIFFCSHDLSGPVPMKLTGIMMKGSVHGAKNIGHTVS